MSDLVVPALSKPTFKQRVWDWSKQPSTLQGVSLIVGGMLMAGLRPFVNAGDVAMLLIGPGIVKLWPDNTTDAIKTRDLTNALVHLAEMRKIQDAVPALVDVVTDISKEKTL